MLTNGLLLLWASASNQPAQPTASPTVCAYDRKLLALGFDAFDQNMSGGWRALSMKPDCKRTAADLIRDYRFNSENQIPLLYWHEAQLRASDGDYAAAIPLMEKSKRSAQRDKFGWNAYADATIAFLRNDSVALSNAREKLARVVRPEGFPTNRPWPLNLDVVDGLARCLGKPYKVAYSQACRQRAPSRSNVR